MPNWQHPQVPSGTFIVTVCPTFPFLSYGTIYRELERTILAANTQEDLKWFSNNHGPGMHMNWPAFEVQHQTFIKKYLQLLNYCNFFILFTFFILLLFIFFFHFPNQEYNPEQASAPPKKKKPDGAPPTPSTDHVAPPGDRSRLVQGITLNHINHISSCLFFFLNKHHKPVGFSILIYALWAT